MSHRARPSSPATRRRVLGSRWAGGAAICGALLASASPSAHAAFLHPTTTEPQARDKIGVRTPARGAWPAAVSSIEFELDQAGYSVAPSPATPTSATLTVAYEGDGGWVLVLEDSVRDLRLEARGGRDTSPQIIGLHAVEMIHASRLDLPKPTRRAPAPPPAPIAEPTSPPPPAATAPTRQVLRPAPDPTSWALDVGVTVSNLGLLGPRIGAVHRWARAELGLVAEAGFFETGRFVGQRVGLGPLRPPPDLAPTWTGHRTVVVPRLGLVGAYVFRPGRAFRPSLGVSNELVMPWVDTEFVGQAPFRQRTRLGYGVAWVPALELAARLATRPKLAIRAAVRIGPTVALKDIPIVESSRTIAFPRGVAMASLGLLFGPD